MLQQLIQEAEHDPHVLGLILDGSRGAGCAWAHSDYDLIWVLTDDAFERRKASGAPMWLPTDETGTRPGAEVGPDETLLDCRYKCVQALREAAAERRQALALATARVLVDKTGGEFRRLIEQAARFLSLPDEEAPAAAERALGAYLNRFYRSLKSWYRGDELAARLHASESVMHLLGGLFALERRVQPHYDRVWCSLDVLDGQGWGVDELPRFFLDILRTGDPRTQIALEARVQALYRERGLFRELDSWRDILPRVRAPFMTSRSTPPTDVSRDRVLSQGRAG